MPEIERIKKKWHAILSSRNKIKNLERSLKIRQIFSNYN